MVTRRTVLAGAAGAGLGGLSGCLDWPGDGVASTPARIGERALANTGYGERTVEELVVDRSIDRFGIEHSIEVINWYAEYDRAVSIAPGLPRLRSAVVSILSTPQLSVFGRTINPVGEYTTDELVALVQDRYDEIGDVRRVDDASITVLGTTATLARYRARARLLAAGAPIDVFLQVSEAVPHGDDFVLGVAIYPQLLGLETESPAVRSLLEAIEHE